jgi:hypothetical protein
MAGRPKTRERNAAAAAAAAKLGVDPSQLGARSNVHTLSPVVDAQRLGDAPTQGRAHAPAGARARTRALTPGRLQHAAVDQNAEQQMRAFGEVLQAESVVRIERVRPSWAEGVCEDFVTDSGSLAELIEHVRDEHGGQRYKLTLLSANGTELMVFKLNVPGAPRFEGKVRARSWWTGDDEQPPRDRNPASVVVAPSSSGGDATMTAMMGLLSTVLERALAPRDNASDVVATVREIAQTSAQQTGALLTAIAQQQSSPQRGIVDQLGEVLQAHRAIGQLRDAIVDDDPRTLAPNAGDGEDSSLLGGALKQAATSLLVQGFQNTQAARRPATPQQRPSQQPQAQQQPPQQAPQPATNVRRVEGRPLRSAE